jgi:hypothetical protein
LADDQPIEQLPDRGELLLDGRRRQRLGAISRRSSGGIAPSSAPMSSRYGIDGLGFDGLLTISIS